MQLSSVWCSVRGSSLLAAVSRAMSLKRHLMIAGLVALAVAPPPIGRAQHSDTSSASAVYDWLKPLASPECGRLPPREMLKFGCSLSVALNDPNRVLAAEGASSQWIWLSELRAADCDALPRGEAEKFDFCGDRPDVPRIEARILVERLIQTRGRLVDRYRALERRRERMEARTAMLATEEQLFRLEEQEALKERLRLELERRDLLAAFEQATATAHRPGGDVMPTPALQFARIRAPAEIFPAPGPEERSIATIPRGTLVLRVGTEVINARRLIFVPAVNFGFVGAAMIANEAIE